MDARPAEHLRSAAYLPAADAGVHANHPLHDGDVPLHDHDFLEIAVVVAGRAVHRTVRGEHALAAGDVLVLHPGQWHAYRAARGLRLWNCCVSPALLARELSWLRADPRCARLLPAVAGERHATAQSVVHVRLAPAALRQAAAACARIRARQREGLPARPGLVAQALQLLDLVAQVLPPGETAAADGPAELAARRMEAELSRPWTLAALAQGLDCGSDHLLRLFRRTHGEAPLAWLRRRRAEAAAVLLLGSEAPVAAIGARVGWDDPNLFARRFRAHFGIAPAAWRRAGAPPPPSGAGWVQW